LRRSSPPYPFRLKSKATPSEQGFIFSLGYPLTFHWLLLIPALGLLLYSAIQNIIPLLIVSTFYLVLALVSRLWSWRSLRQMSSRLTLSQERVFPGEKVDLNFWVANGKWLFLPWLEIEVELPCRLVTGKLKAPSPYSRERLRWTTSISGGQKIGWKYCLESKARGDYQLGPVRLRSGDTLGLFPKELVMPQFESLLVYPRTVPIDRLRLPLRELVGETAVPRNIYEDVSRTIGARDYQPGDPFKRIHWKASARHTPLQVRQYESTTRLSLLLILDVDSFCREPEGDEELFELAVTTVASFAHEAFQQEFSFGLLANSLPEIRLPVRNGRHQLFLLLEALAKIQAASRLPLHEQLDKYKQNLPVGVTLLIVTRALSTPLLSLLQKLCREGNSLLVVSVGQATLATDLSGIRVIAIQSLADLSGSSTRVGP
jgi:uncharacterized protein (DUF58 family)